MNILSHNGGTMQAHRNIFEPGTSSPRHVPMPGTWSGRDTGRGTRINVSGLFPYSLLSALLLIAAGCSTRTPSIDPAVHRALIGEWQKKRLAGLTTETGWLTLAGLGWLHGGENSIGGDSSNVIVLPPGKAPARIGSIFLSDGKITFTASGDAEIFHEGVVVREIGMFSDESPEPTILHTGTLSFYVIKRGDQLGVRIKDSQSPARLNFRGLEYFPVDLKWRFDAKFHPYDPPKFLEIPTQAGTVERDSCPGALEFEIDGTEHRIDAVVEKGAEDRLFIMFSDETSGGETYAVGRQMYTSLPDSNNNVVLDFNLAYNWPCVFTPFATCPIPPRQNTIAHRIEAGEKMYHGDNH